MAEPRQEGDDPTLTSGIGSRDPKARRSISAELPQRVGRYRIDRELGAGGMGVVLRGHDPALDRPVAIKLLHSTALDGASEHALRLVREAQAAAKLSHPNVVSVYEVGADERGPFIAMEYVEGVTVRAWLEEEARDWRRILDVYMQAGRGLAAAHAVGLVHRDMKPDNILVGNDRVRVADFGIARPAGSLPVSPRAAGAAHSDDGGLANTITNTGTVLGTPKYMAPEQREGRACDERSDQYSFCFSLFESLHGRTPSEPASADVRQVPAWLDAAIERGLSSEPTARFGSMEELLAALEPPRSKRRLALAVAASGVIVSGVIGLAVLSRGGADRCAAAGSAIDEVWNPAEQARVEKAILDSGRKYARTTYEHVRAKLDRYAGLWRVSREETCRMSGDTPVRRERQHCLERQLERTRKVIAALREADRRTVDRALIAVTATTRETCSDLAALSRQHSPPDDPAKLERLRAAEAEADAIGLALVTGRSKGLYERSKKLVKEAFALGHGPLMVHALRRHVDVESRLRRDDEQEKTLRDLIQVASKIQEDYEVARAWTQLMLVVARRGKKGVEAALAMQTAADSAIARAGADPALRGELANSLGLIYRYAGRAEESTRMFELSVKLAEERLGPDDVYLASSLLNLAMSYNRRGEHERARKLLLRVVSIRKNGFGEGHPSLISAHGNLGAVSRSLGKLDEAERHYQRAIELVRDNLGPNHPQEARTLHNLGLVYMDRKQLDRADRAFRDALAIHDKSGKGTEGHADVYTSLGFLERSRGRAAEALAHCERGEKLFAEKWPNALRHRDALLCVAKARLMLGKAAAAIEPAEGGLALARKLGLDANARADAEYTLALALWDSKRDRRRALELARSALERTRRPENRKGIAAWLEERKR